MKSRIINRKLKMLMLFALIAASCFAQEQEPTVTISSSSWNYSVEEKDGKYGIVENKTTITSSTGKEDETVEEKRQVLPFEYSAISFYGKSAIVAKGGVSESEIVNAKWAIYDYSAEKFATPFKYDMIRAAGEDIAACNVGGKYVKRIKKATAMSDEYEYHELVGGLWGYIDCTTGKEIIAPQYESAGRFNNGEAMVAKGGVTTLLKNPLLSSDVDINIPETGNKNDETFAFIFANQDYDRFRVPFARNDGKIFREYCLKTLGVPEKNIRFHENATIGVMRSAINKIKDFADVYDGDARFIVYYSGQGFTDPNSKIPYLLPVDASFNNLAVTGYSVEQLNSELSDLSAKSVLFIMDACFNGNDRDGAMLASTRSAVTKPNPHRAEGSLIVLSASSGDESAYQYEDKNHGLFTYFLLKKLQETQGNISYKALADYVTSEVKKQSVSKTKVQSPIIIVSDKLTNWQSLRIKN
jgi:hypothetical protein